MAKTQAEQLGLPPGWKVYSPFPFGGMNQQDSRSGMEDNEFFILENYIRVGKGDLRSLWDHGDSIYNATDGRKIILHFWYNIAATQYVAIFLDDGTADQLRLSDGVLLHISTTPGTFYTAEKPLPACCQSGTQYLLIANNITPNSYWIWDGQHLFSSGTLSPTIFLSASGEGYTSVPTVTASGGTGTGASFTAGIANGSVVSVTVDNPGSGYTAGDVVNLVFTGGGFSTTAAGIATLMPFGVSGSSIETYQSRVWLPFPNQQGQANNGGVFLVSAPGSVTDFATSDGGLVFISNDRFLRQQYTNIRQSNGYLYPFGDSSVDVISNVQTGGSPPTTSFNYQNTDPQVGTSWRDSLQDFGRTILFSNALGVYGLYGGAVAKISKKLDKLFDVAIFPPTFGALTPTSAVASIHNIKCYLLLLTIRDPETELPRNIMIVWNEQDWFLASQTVNLTYISTQEVNSQIRAWGTDGNQIFPLFDKPSAILPKRIFSKLYGVQQLFLTSQALALYFFAKDNTADQVGIETFGEIVTTEIAYPMSLPPVIPAPPGTPSQVFGARTDDIVGQALGFNLRSNSPDFSIYQIILAYMDVDALY